MKICISTISSKHNNSLLINRSVIYVARNAIGMQGNAIFSVKGDTSDVDVELCKKGRQK